MRSPERTWGRRICAAERRRSAGAAGFDSAWVIGGRAFLSGRIGRKLVSPLLFRAGHSPARPGLGNLGKRLDMGVDRFWEPDIHPGIIYKNDAACSGDS
jgi:hypothetical protein